MNVAGDLSLSERVSLILDGLCRAVAARISGGGLEAAVIVLIWGRIKRAEGRLQRLLVRFRAGRIWFRREGAGGSGGRARGVGGAGVRVGRRFGWLLPLVPMHAAGFASQLRGVLEDPEMKALLAAVPQARRVLAPVCRMLALEPALLGVVPAASVPACVVEKAPVVKAVRVRVKPEPFRIPFPRGVLAAARRQGFGRIR